jgi:hypothetical protein
MMQWLERYTRKFNSSTSSKTWISFEKKKEYKAQNYTQRCDATVQLYQEFCFYLPTNAKITVNKGAAGT